MNLPNFISLGRLFSVPVIIWLVLTNQMLSAFWLFAAAGLSDILDGLLARLLKERTTIGSYLDPLADKTLLVGMFITLAVRDYLPLWLVILVVFRDGIIISATLLLMLLQKRISIDPLLISKINTLAQILLVTSVLGFLAIDLPYPNVFIKIMIYLVAGTTIFSSIAYIKLWIEMVSKD